MPTDIFDKVATTGDIFDQVTQGKSVQAKGDIFDHLSPTDMANKELAKSGLSVSGQKGVKTAVTDADTLTGQAQDQAELNGDKAQQSRTNAAFEKSSRERLGAPVQFDTPTPFGGTPEIAAGVVQGAKAKNRDDRYAAASKIVRGGINESVPFMGPAAIESPVGLVKSLATGAAVSKGAGKATEMAGGSPQAQEFAEDAGFFVPSVLGMAGIKGDVAPGGKGARVSGLGDRVAGAVGATPEGGIGIGAKVGEKVFSKTFGGKAQQPAIEPPTIEAPNPVQQATAALVRQRQHAEMASRVANGEPAVPAPKPQGPEVITADHVAQITKVIAAASPTDRPKFIAEAHDELTKWMSGRTRVVNPVTHELTVIDSPKQASATAAKWINEAVKAHETKLEQAAKDNEAKTAAKDKQSDSRPIQPKSDGGGQGNTEAQKPAVEVLPPTNERYSLPLKQHEIDDIESALGRPYQAGDEKSWQKVALNGNAREHTIDAPKPASRIAQSVGDQNAQAISQGMNGAEQKTTQGEPVVPIVKAEDGKISAQLKEEKLHEAPPIQASPEEIAKVGTKDPESGRTIVQPVNDHVVAQEMATQAAPEMAERIESSMKGLEGAKFDRLRPEKKPERVQEKVQDEKEPVNTVGDLGAAQIVVDSREAKDSAISRLNKEFKTVDKTDDYFEKGRGEKGGYRAASVQVQADNGASYEVQIVPREIYEIIEKTHEHYAAARDAELAGDNAKAEAEKKIANDMNDAAWAKFQERNDRRAAPRSETSEVLLNKLHSDLRAESDQKAKAEIQAAIDRESDLGKKDAEAKIEKGSRVSFIDRGKEKSAVVKYHSPEMGVVRLQADGEKGTRNVKLKDVINKTTKILPEISLESNKSLANQGVGATMEAGAKTSPALAKLSKEEQIIGATRDVFAQDEQKRAQVEYLQKTSPEVAEKYLAANPDIQELLAHGNKEANNNVNDGRASAGKVQSIDSGRQGDIQGTSVEAGQGGTDASRASAEGSVPAVGKIGELPTSTIKQDPARFQFKASTDAKGTSTLLKETTKYNPDLAGIISVWQDPADGHVYVINGHHRLELAQRTGHPEVAIKHIDAKDAAEARAVGALQNISEGRGTAIDAAKFMRDTGTTVDKLKEKGVSMGEATAAKGVALSTLDDSLFHAVVQGDLPVERAVAIGEATTDHAEQKAIAELIEKKAKSGKNITNDVVRELVRFVKGSDKTTETSANLFGEQQIEHSLALEKAEVSSYIKQQLAKDKKLFSYVSKESRANELERGNNIIDVKNSQKIAEESAQGEELYNKLSNRSGPIADILDDAAKRLAEGESAHGVKQEAYNDIRTELAEALGAGNRSSLRQREGTPVRAKREASLGGGEDVEPYRQNAKRGELDWAGGLTDDQVGSWSKSRSLTIVEAGEQHTLFGEPEKMYKFTRTDADGQPESALVPQSKVDKLLSEGNKNISAAFHRSRQMQLDNPHSKEAGFATAEAVNPIAFVHAAAEKLNAAYDKGIDVFIQKAHLGRSLPEVERVDPKVASLMREYNAAPQYYRTKAEAIVKDVTDGLSKEQEKGFVLLADKTSREYLAEKKNNLYQKWMNDDKIQAVLEKYKVHEDELRETQKALGGATIEDDYMRRVYDKHVAGVGEGGKADQSYPRFDKVVTPQMANNKGRVASPEYYFNHGLHEFGPSFAARYVASHLKLAEHNIAANFLTKATKLAGGDELPSFIDYNGKRYFSAEAARLIKMSATNSKEGAAIAQELGIEQLPKPSEVKQYGVYTPFTGSKLEGAAKSLAQSAASGDEAAMGKAHGMLTNLGVKYLGPKEVTEAMANDAKHILPQWAQDFGKAIAPVTDAMRQNMLISGIPHIKNILRAVALQRPAGQLDPRAWSDAWKVAFDKTLKERSLAGVTDPAFDALLKHAGMSPEGGIEYKHYLNLNFDEGAWKRAYDVIPAMKEAFADGKIAGAGKVAGEIISSPAHAVNAGMTKVVGKNWHDILFGPGGIDQKGRIWMYDRVKAELPKATDAQIADAVNDSLGRYNRAGWTDMQKDLAPFMLFPGWDYRSVNWALKHPIRSVLPAALITLLANQVIHKLGGNKDKDKNDMKRVHAGGRSFSDSFLKERMAASNPIIQMPMDYASARMRGRQPNEAVGDALAGLGGDAGAILGMANPMISAMPEVASNKRYMGGNVPIFKKPDFKKKGAIVPRALGGKGVEDFASYAIGKVAPQTEAVSGSGDWATLGGRQFGISTYPEKRK